MNAFLSFSTFYSLCYSTRLQTTSPPMLIKLALTSITAPSKIVSILYPSENMDFPLKIHFHPFLDTGSSSSTGISSSSSSTLQKEGKHCSKVIFFFSCLDCQWSLTSASLTVIEKVWRQFKHWTPALAYWSFNVDFFVPPAAAFASFFALAAADFYPFPPPIFSSNCLL